MILILILLNFIFFSKNIEAKSFSHQFVLTNNLIDLNFFKIVDLPVPTPTPTTEIKQNSQKILSFDYKLSKTKDLPPDLPLFIVVFDQKVIFSADASLADGLTHHVQLNLETIDPNYLGKFPVFYQNNYLNDFEFILENLSFINEIESIRENILQIKNLNVIRELDQSLTIVFSLEEQFKNHYSYQMFCLNEKKEVTNSAKLIKNDDFLWSKFSFLNFFSNQKNELIFHLEDFKCDGLVYLSNEFDVRSEEVSIINVKDL